MKDETIFTKKLELNHTEPTYPVDSKAFDDIIKSRRSVRIFSEEILPDKDVKKAVEHGLLAPNSSNLQPWEFHIVKSSEAKKELARYCFSQNGAKTASHLIVCVARTNTWKKHAAMILDQYQESGVEAPPVVKQYYKKIVPTAYGMMGPLGIFSPFKWLFLNFLGLTQVMVRGPIWPSDLKTWAIKSTALACENIMLSLSSMGYDSLPMEGFDEVRVKKLLGLKGGSHVVMVIAAGKRSEQGIYGPQMRFSSENFIHTH